MVANSSASAHKRFQLIFEQTAEKCKPKELLAANFHGTLPLGHLDGAPTNTTRPSPEIEG
jgi:hypothetical protein